MHCISCGSFIEPGARFCAGCGTAVIDPESTRLATPVGGKPPEIKRSADPGAVIFTARPTLLFIKIGYALAALSAILVTALLATFASSWISPLVSIPIALSLLLIPAIYHVKRNSIRYVLTGSEVEIDRGLIARTTRNIPLRAIQDVTVNATIVQRLLGYGDVIIDNSDERRGTVILRNIHNPRHYADLLLQELRRRG
jgi:uncharacterized membrane protein YdbT with pleckstrin-like domain